MRVLLVANEAPDELPSIVSDLTLVPSIAEALEVSKSDEIDGVVVDLRGSVDLADHFEQLRPISETTATIALVRGALTGLILAAEYKIRVVDWAWVQEGDGSLFEILIRDVRSRLRSEELYLLRERQEQLVHAEKFAAVGLLAAEIAHEINNPATFVITNLTVMMDYVATIGQFHDGLHDALRGGQQLDANAVRDMEDQHEIAFLAEDLGTLLERSLAGLNRIHRIVQDLRYFGADRQTTSGVVDLDALVRAAVSLARHDARFRAELRVELPRLPTVRSDAGRLSQVILNIIVNAVQSITAGDPGANEVAIRGEVREDAVIIAVSDTGSGMSPDVLARIFEPFFTTKPLGEGTGLGLAISRDIMRSLGGEIVARSVVGEGSCFEVVIPRESSP